MYYKTEYMNIDSILDHEFSGTNKHCFMTPIYKVCDWFPKEKFDYVFRSLVNKNQLAYNSHPAAVELYLNITFLNYGEPYKNHPISYSPYPEVWETHKIDEAKMQSITEQGEERNKRLLQECVVKKRRPFTIHTIPDGKYLELNWKALCSNTCPDAFEFLRKHLKYVDFDEISQNPSPLALKLLHYKYWDFTHHTKLVLNSYKPAFEYIILNSRVPIDRFIDFYPEMWANEAAAEYLLTNYETKINWHYLSRNPSPIALDYLMKHESQIDWRGFARNSSPRAMAIIERVIPLIVEHNVTSTTVTTNSEIQEIINKGMYMMNLDILYDNPNPNAVKLLLKYKNPNDINYTRLLRRPEIFEYDYQWMRKAKKELNREFTEYYWHPRRVAKFLERGHDMDEMEDYLVL